VPPTSSRRRPWSRRRRAAPRRRPPPRPRRGPTRTPRPPPPPPRRRRRRRRRRPPRRRRRRRRPPPPAAASPPPPPPPAATPPPPEEEEAAPAKVRFAPARSSLASPRPLATAAASKRRLSDTQRALLSRAASGKGGAVRFEGDLLKKGGGTTLFGRRSWNRRYFVLRATGVLEYYRDRAAFLAGAEPLKNAAFHLDHCDVRRATDKAGGERRIVVRPRGDKTRELVLAAIKPDPLGYFDGWTDVLRPVDADGDADADA